MDAGELLRKARGTSGLSQADLARKAGTDRGQISRYESGRVSPTVRTLDALLAACGLQVRATLEPYRADLDELVDALLAEEAVLETYGLPNLVLTLEDDPAGEAHPILRVGRDRGPAQWVFDGHTAVQLQGLALAGTATALALVLDDAARAWLAAQDAQLSVNGTRINPFEATPAELGTATSRPVRSMLGIMQLRFVTELPPHVMLAVPWIERPVPVATVDAVEQAFPRHAEVLQRLRQRRESA